MAGDAARPRERALGHCERGVRGDGDDGLRHGELRRRQPPDRRRRRSEERRVRPPPRGGAGDRRDLGGDARRASGLLERRTGGDADARFRGGSRARAVARRGRARGGAAAERGAARAADRPAPRGARAQQRARPAGRPAAARGPARAAPRRRCRRLLPARPRARRFPLRRGARLRQLAALLRVSDGPGPRRRGRPRRAAVDRERVRRDRRPRAASGLRRLHRRDHSADVLERRGARGARRRAARGAPFHDRDAGHPRGLRGPRLARVAERGDVHAERAAGADPAGLLPDRVGARAVAVSRCDARGGRRRLPRRRSEAARLRCSSPRAGGSRRSGRTSCPRTCARSSPSAPGPAEPALRAPPSRDASSPRSSIADDDRLLPDLRDAAATNGYHSLISVPVDAPRDAGRGLVLIFFAEERSFSDDDLELARHLADATRGALERSELFEAERSAPARSRSS